MSSIIKGIISELNPDLQKRLAARKAGQITSFDKPIASPKAPTAPAAPSSPVTKPSVNPELQKRLAARKAGKPVYSGGLEEGQDRQAELEMALQKARQITKQIKYDDTATDIIVQIQMLAEKFNIDKDSLESAIDDVYNAKNQLESAVYGLDEVFEEALQQTRWDDDELDEEKQGLWANIHAKRERIKHGSGERMRKPGSKGAPSAQDFKDSQKTSKNESVAEGSTQKYEMMMRNGQVKKFVAKDDADAKRIAAGHGAKSVIRLRGGVPAGKVSEQGVAEEQLDEKCWDTHKQVGMKKKGDKMVPNCVPKESVEEDTSYAGGMGQGGNAGQSYRKYKVTPSGIGKGISETEAVNRNDGPGWRWTKIEPAGK